MASLNLRRALAWRPRRKPPLAAIRSLAFVAAGLLGIVARAYVVRKSYGSNDMTTWIGFAHLVRDHGLGYAYENEATFNHPPLMGLMASSLLKLSERTGVRFEVLFKIPSILADVLSAVLVYRAVFVRSARLAPVAFALFLLNPISISITAYHGNTDAMCAALALLAASLVDGAWPLLGGLALGASINVKLIPLILIPLLASRSTDARGFARFMIGLGVGAIPFVPILIHDWRSFYTHAIAYHSSPYWWGITVVLAQLGEAPYVAATSHHLNAVWIRVGAKVILASMLALGLANVAKQRWSAKELTACGFGLFLVLAPGWGVQYLAYLAPGLFAVRLGPALAYSVFAGAHACLLYYTSWNGLEPYYSFIRLPLPPGVQGIGYLAWLVIVYAVVDILDPAALVRLWRAQWTSESRVGGVRARVREWLFLRRAENVALGIGERHGSMRAHYEAALGLWSTARNLKGGRQAATVVSLYRDAGLRFVTAFLLVGEGGTDAAGLAPADAFDRLERALASRGWKAHPAFEAVKGSWLESKAAGSTHPPSAGSGQTMDTLETATRWLASLVDPRSARELKATRLVRTVLASGVALYLAVRLVSPKNLAYGRPATASSAAFDTTADGAVDGDNSSPFGFHSQTEDSPWLTIDLGHSYEVTKVKVYGRGDCCYDQSIPLALQISADGVHFRKIAERGEPFSQLDPWVVSGDPFVGRFVNLTTERHSMLVVSEIEVYGRETE